MTYPSEDEVNEHTCCDRLVSVALGLISLVTACYAIHLNAVLANRVGMVIVVQQSQQDSIDRLEERERAGK